MNIQSLRYFVAVAEGETVSKVAERFYITQPALSRSIQRLESELQCKLFDRSTTSLQITHQGKAILPIARQLLCLADDLRATAQDYTCGRNSLLTIGCCGIEGEAFYSLVALIRHHYNSMQIQTPKFFSLSDVIGKVLNKEVDCCFAYSGYHYEGDSLLEHLPLQPSRLQLVVPKGHPFFSLSSVHAGDLAEEKLLLWRRDMFPDYFDSFSEKLLLNGVTPHISGSFISKQELFSKVAVGDGLALVHSTEIYHPDNAPFAYVDLLNNDGSPFYQGSVSLFWSKNSNNPALSLVTALAKENISSLLSK